MTNILKLIWFRILHSKEILILSICAFACSLMYVVILGIQSNLIYYSAIQSGIQPVDQIFRSDTMIELLSPTSLPMVLCYVAISLFITGDWKNNTFRNQVLAGKNRNQVYFSYFLFAIAVYLFFLAITIVPIYSIGYCFHLGELNAMETPFILTLFIYFIIGLTFVLYIFAFSFIFHNRLAPLGLLIALYSVTQTFGSILMILPYISNSKGTFLLNTYPFSEFLIGYQMAKAKTCNVDVYYFGKITDGHITASIGNGRTTIFVLKTFFTNLIWQGLLTYFGNIAFRKRDMK